MIRAKSVVMLMVFLLLFAPISSTYADNNYATPNYEIKFYLDSEQVLNSDNKLKESVRDEFDMPDSVTKMRIQYLDTDDLELDEEGWTSRIRKKEDADNFELTYKKRYPVASGDVESALAQAAADGFDEDENDYEAQIDWGYGKMTLSFSNNKSCDISGYDGMEMPDLQDSIDEAVDHAPGKFEDWLYNNWGTDKLEESRIYGYVKAKRYIGEWSDNETYIEIWEILNEAGTGYEYITEISFKADNYSYASQKREELRNLLQQRGWLINQDILKTNMILNRY